MKNSLDFLSLYSGVLPFKEACLKPIQKSFDAGIDLKCSNVVSLMNYPKLEDQEIIESFYRTKDYSLDRVPAIYIKNLSLYILLVPTSEVFYLTHVRPYGINSGYEPKDDTRSSEERLKHLEEKNKKVDYNNLWIPADIEEYYYDAGNIHVNSLGMASLDSLGGKDAESVTTSVFIDMAKGGNNNYLDLIGLGVNLSDKRELSTKFKEHVARSLKTISNRKTYPVENAKSSVYSTNNAVSESLDDWLQNDAKTVSVDAVYTYLDSYFNTFKEASKDPTKLDESTLTHEKVPLLIGPTGVFKSATVKELADKYDYRLVDMRVAFKSRVDFNGLFNFHIDADNDIETFTSAPMEEILTCSDSYRAYCAKAIIKLKEILSKDKITLVEKSAITGKMEEIERGLTPQEASKLAGLVEQYSYYVKTPVLFFDEITRLKDIGTRSVLVKLLNNKILGSHTLKGAVFIAATNWDPDTDISEMYDTEDTDDVAWADRFIPFQVLPDSVQDRWMSWGKSARPRVEYSSTGKKLKTSYDERANIHPAVMQYLEKFTSDCYNVQPIKSAINNPRYGDDSEAATLTPYPNYRSWTQVSDYLYNCEDRAKGTDVALNQDIIAGFVGDRACEKLLDVLLHKGKDTKVVYTGKYKYSLAKPSEHGDLTDFMFESLDAGIPSIAITPSAMGKTSRIYQYMKKYPGEYELIEINLASLERTDLNGMPKLVSIGSYIGKGVGLASIKGGVTSLVNQELSNIMREQNDTGKMGKLDSITINAPNGDIYNKFKKAYDAGKKIILFFDEPNRVSSPVLMSAVFEAVSDNRIFNVHFDPTRVKIVCAANFGKSTSDAKKLDPAFAARFAMKRKLDYEKEDVDSFLSYLKSEEMTTANPKGTIHPVLVSFFEEKVKADPMGALDWLRSIDSRKMETSVPSSRALSELGRNIKNMSSASAFCGCVINYDSSASTKIEGFLKPARLDIANKQVTNSLVGLKALTTLIKGRASTWFAANPQAGPLGKIKLGNREITGSDLLRDYFAIVADIDNNLNDNDRILKNLQALIKIVTTILDIDSQYKSSRKGIFTSYLGNGASTEFSDYFEKNFTMIKRVVEMKDLSNKDLISEYVTNRFNSKSINNVTARSREAISAIVDFNDFWKSKLSPEHYYIYLKEVLGVATSTAEQVSTLIANYPQDKVEFFLNLERYGDNYIAEILTTAGQHIQPTDVNKFRLSMEGKSLTGVSGDVLMRKNRIL